MKTLSRLRFTFPWVLIGAMAFVSAAWAQKADFDVWEYSVVGNTRLKAIQIEEAVYPFLGPEKTIKDVEAARGSLEKAYQKLGFVTVAVDIPEQSTTSGVITLNVVEGKIDRLSIKGSKYYAASMIREKLPELASGSVPNAETVKTEIAQLNRTANRRVIPVLKPGKAPGTVDVEVAVEDVLPISGSVSLSNFRPAASKNELRLSADVRFENVGESFFGTGHTLGLGIFTTPQDFSDTRLISANYLIPTLNNGTFMLFALRSNTESLEPVAGSLIQGKYSQVGLRYFYVMSENATSRLSLVLGLDRKSNEQKVASTGAGPLTYQPITVGVNYQTGDSKDLWKLDTSWVSGLSGGAKADKEFAARRLGASSDFAALKFDLSNDRSLGSQWRLRSKASVQISNAPLINLEQAIAGGYDTVRGYFEAEQVGDRALRGSVELGYLLKPSISWLTRAELVAFIDTARLSVLSPAVGQLDSFNLASVGLGSRLSFGRSWQLASDLAYALRSSGKTEKGDLRLLARFRYEY